MAIERDTNAGSPRRRKVLGSLAAAGVLVAGVTYGFFHESATHTKSKPKYEPTPTPLPYSTDLRSYKYRIAFVPGDFSATVHEYTNYLPKVTQSSNGDKRVLIGKDVYCPQKQDRLEDDNVRFNLGCDNPYNRELIITTSDDITVVSNNTHWRTSLGSDMIATAYTDACDYSTSWITYNIAWYFFTVPCFNYMHLHAHLCYVVDSYKSWYNRVDVSYGVYNFSCRGW